MIHRTPWIAAVLAVLAFAGVGQAGEEPKTGLEPVAFRPSFIVQDVTGSYAGALVCYACAYGIRPTIYVLTRELTEPLADLIEEQIEAVLGAIPTLIND